MKKYLLLFVVPFCVACTDNMELNVEGNYQTTSSIIPTEEAFPGVEKEIYITNSGIALQKIDSLYILQGDMILSSEQVAALDELQTRGALITKTSSYWDFCKVYYEFAPGYSYQSEALQAMAKISAATGVTFLPKTSSSKNYIYFIHANGNYSGYGKVGGKQDLSILTNQGSVVGITMHELLHALGIFHEMSRTDRDNFVEILWNNIEKDKDHNFKKFTDLGFPGANIGGFNYNSIMMYPSTAFGKYINGVLQQTIRRKDGQSYTTQRSYLADTDIAALKAIYGPPYVGTRTEIKIRNLQDDGYNYVYEADLPTYADFYKDKEFKIKETLTSPRYLTICRYESTGGSGYVEKYTTILVPAGTSSYLVGTGYENTVENWGSPAQSWRIKYAIINCHHNGY